MTWLTTTHQVPGVVLVLAAFAIGSVVAAVIGEYHDLANQRWHQARRDACEASARARTAERPYRQRLAPSRRGLYAKATPIAVSAPTDDELDAWDAEIDGLPWGYAMNQRPVDVRTVVDDEGATVHRIVPERPSTAIVRALVGVA